MLIVGCFLTDCVFAVPKVFTTSEAIDESHTDSLTRRVRTTATRMGENGVTDVPEAEYRERLTRIRRLIDQGKRDEIIKEGDEIQDIWAKEGGERYAKLILEVLNSFGYSRIADGDPELGSLAEKYAIVALERADFYSLESEYCLLGRLGYSPDIPSFSASEVVKLRNSSRLWMHLLARLQREKDPSADPYFVDPPKQLDAPEDPRWNGVVDSGAMAAFEKETKVYNEKRKWLSDQYKLRNVEELAVPRGRKFLANVYSRPPFSRDELNALLSEYAIAEVLRTSILKARDDLAPGVGSKLTLSV